ncbi:hypothetical protein Hanom_Chr17g01544671 [Helianthus anomalus]
MEYNDPFHSFVHSITLSISFSHLFHYAITNRPSVSHHPPLVEITTVLTLFGSSDAWTTSTS